MNYQPRDPHFDIATGLRADALQAIEDLKSIRKLHVEGVIHDALDDCISDLTAIAEDAEAGQ